MSTTKTKMQIDPDTGLPIELLREELQKGLDSPTVEFSLEKIKSKGKQKLQKLDQAYR